MSRLYLPSTGTPSVSPAFAAAYEDTSNAVRLTAVLTKIASAMATKTMSVGPSGAGTDSLFFQYVTEPLAAGCVFTVGDVIKGQIRCSEANANSDQTILYSLRVYSEDGSTLRATLRSAGETTEYATALTNRTIGNTVNANYTTVSGDRLVIELGSNRGNTSGNGSMRNGDSAASDLPEDETDTNDFNPWVELPSTTLTLLAAGGLSLKSRNYEG